MSGVYVDFHAKLVILNVRFLDVVEKFGVPSDSPVGMGRNRKVSTATGDQAV